MSQGWHYYADRGRDQVNASVSHYADKFGKHELKFGAEFEHSKVRNRYGYATNANFPHGVYYYDYGGAPYLAYSYGYDVTATNNRTSAFVQDSWKVGDRLTINPGVRLDLIRGSNPSVGQVYSANNLAPRLGFAWDVTGDYNTVVKGAYSQYYEGAMATVFERGIPGVQPKLVYDVSGGTPVLTDTIDHPIYKIDPNIKHPRVDEVYGAVERAIGGSMRLTVTGIYRENKNFINSISPNATWTPVTVANGLTNAPLTLYKWANRAATQTDFLIENIAGYQYKDPSGNVIGTADPYRKYKAMMVVLNKRLSNRWTTQISYVLSEATGSVDNTGDAQVSSRQFETPVLALVNVGRQSHERPDARVQGARQLHDSRDRSGSQRVLAHDQRTHVHAVPAVHIVCAGPVRSVQFVPASVPRDAGQRTQSAGTDRRSQLRESVPNHIARPYRRLHADTERVQRQHDHVDAEPRAERDHCRRAEPGVVWRARNDLRRTSGQHRREVELLKAG